MLSVQPEEADRDRRRQIDQLRFFFSSGDVIRCSDGRDLIKLEIVLHTLRTDGQASRNGERCLDQLPGIRRDQNLSVHRIAFDPAAEVHLTSDHVKPGPLFGAEVSDHDIAAVDTDPHLQRRIAPLFIPGIDRRKTGLHGKSSGNSMLRMVRVVSESSENSQDAVSLDLDQGSAELFDQLDHLSEIMVQHQDQDLCVDVFTQGSETPQVAHHHRDQALLSAHGKGIRRFDQFVYDLIRKISAEGFFQKVIPTV